MIFARLHAAHRAGVAFHGCAAHRRFTHRARGGGVFAHLPTLADRGDVAYLDRDGRRGAGRTGERRLINARRTANE